jgi:hypothetical protein
MVFGKSRWLQTALDPATQATTMEIEVPLAIFAATDISFTVPDSMIAFMFAQQQEAGAPLPEHYGQLYTLPEICSLVEMHGLPGGTWGNSLPATVPNYIEAQVWNPGPLRALLRQL